MRFALLSVVVLLFSLIVPLSDAHAQMICTKYDKFGNCTKTVEIPGDNGGSSEGSGGGSSSGVKVPPARCIGADGGDVKCRTKYGEWHNGYRCWVKLRDDGIAVCHAEDDNETLILPGDYEPSPPDPRVMAWQLVAQINIQAGDIGLVPIGEHALVGMPTWMWVDNPGPSTTGPVTRSATAQGYTVTIEARLAKVVYTMGDGTTVTCAGANAPGTKYLDRYGLEPSPTCGHRYRQPGSYTVTATSQWEVAWYGIGEAGVIPLSLQRSVQVAVREGHAVVR